MAKKAEAAVDHSLENRGSVLPLINKLKSVDMSSGSFNVLDDDGATWKVTLERQ